MGCYYSIYASKKLKRADNYVDFFSLEGKEFIAKIVDVYDGDTITCKIDLGFKINAYKQKIRLYDIDTPELRGEERERGLYYRDKLREKILHKDIILKTIKDKRGKYGRILGIIYIDDLNINEWLKTI